MAADGLITLPRPVVATATAATPATGIPGSSPCRSPRPPLTWPPSDPVTTTIIIIGHEQSRRWNTLIRDRHYLGYTPLAGAQIRYLAVPNG